MRDVTEAQWLALRTAGSEGESVLAGGPMYSEKGNKRYVMDWDLSADEWIRMEIP